mmetsp:Transcript_37546/g.117362  ORF Transcript_37546/g.117362 Transcript_37546/m.117362 type:complete len:520 (-) Transcript_37546:148-1707(-)
MLMPMLMPNSVPDPDPNLESEMKELRKKEKKEAKKVEEPVAVDDDLPTWDEVVASAETDPNADANAIEIAQRVLEVAKPGKARSFKLKAQGIKFRSLLSYNVRIFWHNGKGMGVPQSTLYAGEDMTTNSYIGHTFKFYKQHKDELVTSITVQKGQVIYLIQDGGEVSDKKLMRHTQEQLAFMKAYEEKAGRPWVAVYPKPPLENDNNYMLEPGNIGDVKKVRTEYGMFDCVPAKKQLPWNPEVHTDCAPGEGFELEIKTVSVEPRAFVVENFFSEVEAAHIRDIATPRLKRSQVGNSAKDGGYKSNTRTSSNAWVGRDDSPIIDQMHRRAADMLNIDESIIWHNGTGRAEQLQVVYYKDRQEYTSHHDWDGTSQVTRLVTVLLYLNDQAHPQAGGETAFPKAWTPSGRDGIKVPPKTGRAVIFYSQLPDGNCDDYSLHAALPVTDGEKWLANFWIHNGPRKNNEVPYTPPAKRGAAGSAKATAAGEGDAAASTATPGESVGEKLAEGLRNLVGTVSSFW